MIRFLLLPLLLQITLSACSQNGSSHSNSADFKYDLGHPEQIFKLPAELIEISGIAITEDKKILCIQDEVGIIYTYNPLTKNIDKTLRFEGKGDFEEVAIVGKDAYVLKSNGDIYQIENFESESWKQNKFETTLKQKYDSEGLCYDPKNKRLLVTSKEFDEKKKHNTEKYIYGFDIGSKALTKSPIYKINLTEVKKHLEQSTERSFIKSLVTALENNDIDQVFKPSAIAKHPLTDQLYILSATNKLLLILNAEGQIENVFHLNHPDVHQPEGITFSSSGDLYISNEGKANKTEGNILMFTYGK